MTDSTLYASEPTGAAYPPVGFHSIDFPLVLADVEIAMEKARKAHHPHVLAKALRLYDMFTVAMTQQALSLDQTSDRSCATATSCCVCGHVDEASLTTCATCMMNCHKECVESFVHYVVGLGKVSSIHCRCSPLQSAIFKGALCKVCLAANVFDNAGA